MLLLLLLQASSAQPDIELRAAVDARSVRIEKKGEAELTVSASPDGGSEVKVEAPKADGARTLRNVHVTVDAEARIGDPSEGGGDAKKEDETPSPN